jgi:hypothetical protein
LNSGFGAWVRTEERLGGRLTVPNDPRAARADVRSAIFGASMIA